MQRSLNAAELGFDTFGTACGLGLVAGALAIVVPTFAVLTLTMVALALAGWVALHRQATPRAGRGDGLGGARTVGLEVLSAAAVLFFVLPPALGAWRGLLLGLGLVPLWVAERGRPGGVRCHRRRS